MLFEAKLLFIVFDLVIWEKVRDERYIFHQATFSLYLPDLDELERVLDTIEKFSQQPSRSYQTLL